MRDDLIVFVTEKGRKMAGARFANYMRPLIDALRELGNSGTPSEVRDTIAKNLELTDGQIEEQNKSGASRFHNDLHWARYYLAKEGYLDSSTRGVWSLTEKGIKSNLTPQKAQEIAKKVHRDDKLGGKAPTDSDEDELPAPSDSSESPTGNHRTVLLDIMKQMTPNSFEKLCQRLLRESGFQQVQVTGRSGDGGIDGRGLLKINPLMSIHVLFQCKRYKGSVGSEAIRNFRGSMTGRTDKGIFITTGTFTEDAKREALREGAPPIELVDADNLVEMFEKLGLGLTPKIAYEIDEEFFNEFS
jgi:restriction system protein